MTEEEKREMIRILEDASKLKKLAVDYLHPELPVKTADATGAVFGRSYFGRPSAADGDKEEEEERARILADAAALKKFAVDYMHPELPVKTTDATACARNYFSQPWASEKETFYEAEQRALALADAAALKKLAMDYMHPERPLSTDAAAYGRNYFTRPSAPDCEEEEEREMILEEAAALKKLAVDYMHPELPVSTDATASARNYFTRPSAVEQEDDDFADEREIILEEMKELKQLALQYRHPERPVEVDPTAFGRNYFARASGDDSEVFEEAEERARILADAAALKKLAVDYMHPEHSVTTTDSFACGRNYFTRPSAPIHDEEDDERAQILAEAAALKKLAVDYLHPERPVVTSDPTACGRNYFSRASAEEYEDDETDEEHDQILEDMAALKRLAVDYRHPERPVEADPAAFGRNYYSRASAPDKETFYEAEQRALVLTDAAALKKLAIDYQHPELPVPATSAACARNYYGRPSAPEQEDDEYADERQVILEEMVELKQLAGNYHHPERPVEVDPTSMGRNYFDRASAADQESVDNAEERARILADAAALKKLATDYLHPELPVVTSDPTACGRNYHSRPSAPSRESHFKAEQRARILADAAALKKLAVHYRHPELPVATTDATACGRNFFVRPSAPVCEEEEERQAILADAAALKKLAVDYQHPELPVATDPTAFGRNYFGRASAPEQDPEDALEVEHILQEAAMLKRLAVDYRHPEIKIVTTDATACGRNYFSRASAFGVAGHIHSTGYANSHPVDQQQGGEEYGHFDMDEDEFYDMRQTLVLPGDAHAHHDHHHSTDAKPTVSDKIGSDEEGELSRSPSSVMLFTGALEESEQLRLPTMG
jgi:hypothetical protein